MIQHEVIWLAQNIGHFTIFHLLGLPANDLTYWYAGRDHRLTAPEGGRAVLELLA